MTLAQRLGRAGAGHCRSSTWRRWKSEALAILRQGDRTNARRSKLAPALGPKAAAERYAAFLELVPGADRRARRGARRRGAGHGRSTPMPRRARLAALAPRLSLDPAATVFQLGGSSLGLPLKRLGARR